MSKLKQYNMSNFLFKTEDNKGKKVGDAYYCVQDGTGHGHMYPLMIQLIKIEDNSRLTSKNEFDSVLALNDNGIKRFHNKKVAKKYLKYLKFLKSTI